MKKLYLIILILIILSCGILTGCSADGTPEKAQFTITKNDNWKQSVVSGSFSVKARNSLIKVTYTIDVLDAKGKLLTSEDLEHYHYNGYAYRDNDNDKVRDEVKDTINIDYDISEISLDASRVEVRNVKYTYDDNWLLGLGFGLVGAFGFILVVSFFIVTKKKEISNK